MKPAESSHNPREGIPLVLIGCLFNAAMATCVKFASVYVSTESIIFFRFFVSLILLLIALPFQLKKKSLTEALKLNKISYSVVRIIASILCLFTYFYAIKKIELSTAVVLVMSSSLFLPFVSKIWKKTKIPPLIWIPLITGFVGIALIVGPSFHEGFIGVVSAIVAAVFASIGIMAGRYQTKTDSAYKVNFWLYVFGSLITLPWGLISFLSVVKNLPFLTWITLILVGFFGVFYQYFLISALNKTRARFVGGFTYFTIIFAYISNWIFFGFSPTFTTYLGALMVLFGGVLMVLVDRR